MTSYAYEENNLIDKAKFLALNSLKQSSNDLWSWHALLHVNDNENNDSINKNNNLGSKSSEYVEQILQENVIGYVESWNDR